MYRNDEESQDLGEGLRAEMKNKRNLDLFSFKIVGYLERAW